MTMVLLYCVPQYFCDAAITGKLPLVAAAYGTAYLFFCFPNFVGLDILVGWVNRLEVVIVLVNLFLESIGWIIAANGGM